MSQPPQRPRHRPTTIPNTSSFFPRREIARNFPAKDMDKTPKSLKTSLRFQLAFVSIGRKLQASPIPSLWPTRLRIPEHPPVVRKGTAAALDHPGLLLPSRRAVRDTRAIPVDTLAIEALDDFTPNLCLDIRVPVHKLAAALISHVESQALLPGWSGQIVAVACMVFAYHALLHVHNSPADGKTFAFLAAFGIERDAARSGYNALWLFREELRDVVQFGGGRVEGLRLPRNRMGGTSVLVRREKMGLPYDLSHYQAQGRERRKEVGRSPLRQAEGCGDEEEGEDEDAVEMEELRELVGLFWAMKARVEPSEVPLPESPDGK
ncbi:uncharacterized protein LTR77_003538 [Saxophila tyrrhenica]|uniref:Uncharacterized protein n=1 Tax=Saxophila tyrrhenica TaxID=1690608 RepID=A0AAV9PHC2_9PEZI|nr:hypothetical protein LTR77_003538 [Saxophila tyrrhenica]